MPKRAATPFVSCSHEPSSVSQPLSDIVTTPASSPRTQAGLWALRDSSSCHSDLLVDLERAEEDDILESGVASIYPEDNAEDNLTNLVSHWSLGNDLSLVLRPPLPVAPRVSTSSNSGVGRAGSASICDQPLAAPVNAIPKLELKAPN